MKVQKKRIKYKIGDYFAFEISENKYAFAQILLDRNKLNNKKIIDEKHGLSMYMGVALLVKVYQFISTKKDIDVGLLKKTPVLPTIFMMDEYIYRGQYEIIGADKLTLNDFDFPMCYREGCKKSDEIVFFQWGLIHKELSIHKFNKYLSEEDVTEPLGSVYRIRKNTYSRYSNGLTCGYSKADIAAAIKNKYIYKDLEKDKSHDLRNPKYKEIRAEIMTAFGLNPTLSYDENCKLSGTISTTDLLKIID
jgi:hypothetical protein